MHRRAFLRSAPALVLTGAAAGCLEGSASTAGDWDVGMTARAFEPEVLRVDPGTEVTWRNTNPHAHSVTAYEDGIPDEATYFATGEFDSESAARDGYANGEGRLFTDEEFAHTFEVPGTYNYFCIPHEKAGMVGAVEVGDDGSGTDAES